MKLRKSKKKMWKSHVKLQKCKALSSKLSNTDTDLHKKKKLKIVKK